jgi:organic hydroperoxide reductase OsmC/OhrA
MTMHPYPHVYEATADAAPVDSVAVGSPGLPALSTSPPPQFDGPEGNWSPETLLCASVADCLILTFRAVARASKLDWHRISCRTVGTLEKVEGNSRFTRFVSHVTLHVPAGTDTSRAKLLLEKSEHGCLVANSLTGTRELVATIVDG